MIITKTPFRVSFAGGGSDFKEFYSQYPGSVVNVTINRYMFILVHPFFDERIQIKYSRTELVREADEIRHPIVREVVKKFKVKGIDINSIADIPAGTGLGSSGSFTVGLLHALYVFAGERPAKDLLAREACRVEIDVLKEPIGKQDQYAAAFGGLNFMTFRPDDTVDVEPVRMPEEKYREFESHLLFFYLGGTRPAGEILMDQKRHMVSDPKMFRKVKRLTELAKTLKISLEAGDLTDVGKMLDEGWRLKKELSSKISNNQIDYYYDLAKNHGADGGKLLGAGGGGFLMLYCRKEAQPELRLSLKALRECKFKFEPRGTQLIYHAP